MTPIAEPDTATHTNAHPDAPPPRDHGDPVRDRDRGGPALERITVNLSRRSVAALDSIVGRSGETKTDAINKALQVWDYLQGHLESGGAVYTRTAGSDELERLRFL